jgi:hypothetical protein
VRQVEERIKELQGLKPGWLDNEHGRALPEEGLSWLEGLLIRLMVERYLPKPRLYATPDGEVEAEWSFGAWEVSATLDLDKKSAWMHAANVQTLEDAEETLALETLTGVERLVAFLMQYGTFGPEVA